MQHHPDRNVGDARGRGQIQGSGRGLRGAPRSAQTPDLRSLRARRPGRQRHAELRQRRRGHGHVRRHLRRLVRRTAAAGGPQGGRDLQMAIEIDLLRSGTRRAERNQDSSRGACCRLLRQRGEAGHQARATAGAATATASSSRARASFAFSRPAARAADRAWSSPIPAAPATDAAPSRSRRSLTVNIPPGVDNDMSIRLSGEGEAGERGARRAICTASSASASIRCSSATGRTCTAKCR